MNSSFKLLMKHGNNAAKQFSLYNYINIFIPRFRNRSLYSLSNSLEYNDFINRLDVYRGGNVTLNCNDKTGVGLVLLDNPERKNALTGSMMIQLRDIVERLEKWNCGKAIVLCGTEKMFCSGGDLKILMDHLKTPKEGAYMCQFMQDVLFRFTQLPLVSVAAIQGMALGGGAEIATACDFRLMNKNAAIQFVQSIMGITTGWGGGSRLVNIVGRKKALQLLLTANRLNYGNALDMGLVDGSVSDFVDPIKCATDWLEQRGYLSKDVQLTHAIKKFVDYSSSASLADSYIYERQMFEQFWCGDLHSEALRMKIKHR